MAEFNIQSDSVDVTRIMEQIRERIREKRGADYTEEQIQELASVKLERFLDPRQVRSGLVEQYRQLDAPDGLDPIHWAIPGPPPEPFEFDTETIYKSSRGPTGTIIQMIRKLLNPFLKLLFNPDPLVFALSRQAEINAYTLQLLQQQTDLAERVTKQFERAGAKFQAREELDSLNYEVLNNLVVEMTRLSVDMKNHMMRVESVAGRLDFAERRARALETVVQSRSTPATEESGSAEGETAASGSGTGRTRRRRRRSRRRGSGSGEGNAATSQPAQNSDGNAATATPAEGPTASSGAPAAVDTIATPAGPAEEPQASEGPTRVDAPSDGGSDTAAAGPPEGAPAQQPEAPPAPEPEAAPAPQPETPAPQTDAAAPPSEPAPVETPAPPPEPAAAPPSPPAPASPSEASVTPAESGGDQGPQQNSPAAPASADPAPTERSDGTDEQ